VLALGVVDVGIRIVDEHSRELSRWLANSEFGQVGASIGTR